MLIFFFQVALEHAALLQQFFPETERRFAIFISEQFETTQNVFKIRAKEFVPKLYKNL